VNINVKRTESGQGDSKQTQLIISDWSEACAIDPRYAELAKAFDLPKIYAASTIEYQKRQFGVEGQAEGQPVQPQSGLQRTPVNAGQPAPGAGYRQRLHGLSFGYRQYQQNQGGGQQGPNFSR
jgi:hypothetical protein